MSKKLLLSIFFALVFAVCVHIVALATETGSNEFVLPIRNPKVHPVVQKQIDENVEEPLNVWVLFTDKGVLDEPSFLSAARRYEQSMLERTKWRSRLRARHGMVDLPDLPVSEKYVKGIIKLDAKHRATSRWLNAVSVSASPDVIKKIAKLKYVRAIDPVAKGYCPIPVESEDGSGSSKYQKAPSQPVPGEGGLNYGGSAPQIEQINVHKLHDMGYHGEGVIVGVLDAGFDLSHEAFQHLEVIAQHDFIHNDDITANEPGQDASPQQDHHGTKVLSIIGGYRPGELIGPAFSARYLLAKSEENSFERPIEEDWCVEGIEWLEHQGADVITASLYFIDWYQPQDIDGKTAKFTLAADIAVDKGVVFTTSAGNFGHIKWQGHPFFRRIGPPADGFKVITVGAVDANGIVASWSSRGPTADGRIKPDVMARGTIGTVMAEPYSTSDYRTNSSGTSFATPLVAGTAALLLQAFPTATPADIALALKSTASNASAPNNDCGWGIVNAEAAYEFLVENIAMSETVPPVAVNDLSIAGKKPGSITLITTFGYIKQTALFQNYPNPFNPETWIPYRLANDADVVIWIYDSAGCLIRELNLGQRKAGFYLDKDKAAYWDGKNSLGEQVASGAYFYQLEAGDFVAIRKLAIVK
jgi:serine protease AprX